MTAEVPVTPTHDELCESIDVDIGVGNMHSPCGCRERQLERECSELRERLAAAEKLQKATHQDFLNACELIDAERRVQVALHDRAEAAEASLKSAKETVARLRDALKPFALFSSGYGRLAREDGWVLVTSGTGKRVLTMGDVRAAEDAIDAARGAP